MLNETSTQPTTASSKTKWAIGLTEKVWEKLRVISKWRWRPPADTREKEEWKLQRTSQGLRPRDNSCTWPGRPRSRTAPAGARPSCPAPPRTCSTLLSWPHAWEKFVTKGLCYGCGGDWDFKGALKVDINSSDYTGYKYNHKKPGFRIKARSCEDARFLHINYLLLAEVRHFEKVSVLFKDFLQNFWTTVKFPVSPRWR